MIQGASHPVKQAVNDLEQVVKGQNSIEEQLAFFSRAQKTLISFRGRVPSACASRIVHMLVDIHWRARESDINPLFTADSSESARAVPANSTFEHNAIPMIRNALAGNESAVKRGLIQKVVNYGCTKDGAKESQMMLLLREFIEMNAKAKDWALECLGCKNGSLAEQLKAEIDHPQKPKTAAKLSMEPYYSGNVNWERPSRERIDPSKLPGPNKILALNG